MTETPPGKKPIRRVAAGTTAEGERRVVAKLDPHKPATQPPKTRHAATLSKRDSAQAPKNQLSLKKAQEGQLGANRRVVAKLDDLNLSAMVETDLLGEAGRSALLKSYDTKLTKGKTIAGTSAGAERMREARQMQASASFSTAIAQFGISPEFDNFDTLDILAIHLIELLQSNVYGFQNLTRYERNILFRYFHKYNPIIARIIDLHTDLPLSKARLQAPHDVPEIVRDYVMQFFERVFERLNVNELLRDMVLAYYIYGEAYVQVEDFFAEKADRVLQDITKLEEKVYVHEEEDLDFLQKVEKDYSDDPKKVGLKRRMKYMEKKFENFFDPDYTGPTRMSVLRFYNILEYLENGDIDFEAVRYGVSDSYKRLKEQGFDREQLAELGYSEGFLELQELTDQTDSYTIDNDIYSGLPFIFTFRRTDSTSLITRILNQAIEWDAAQRAFKALIENLGKLGRIVFAENISEAQTEALRAEVMMMLEDPNHAVVANYKIEWNEVNAFLKEELTNLIERISALEAETALGLGIPDTLLSGDSAYSGDSVKLDLLNTYYLGFNQRLQNVMEEHVIKPIALRKGFVTIDEWGNPTLIHPKLTFSRMGLRDSNVLDILFSLYQKGSLPVSIILDVLNLDPEDVKRGIEKDLWTVNDPNFNGIIQELYMQAGGDVYQETTLKEKLIAALKLVSRYPNTTATSPATMNLMGGATNGGATTGGADPTAAG